MLLLYFVLLVADELLIYDFLRAKSKIGIFQDTTKKII